MTSGISARLKSTDNANELAPIDHTALTRASDRTIMYVPPDDKEYFVSDAVKLKTVSAISTRNKVLILLKKRHLADLIKPHLTEGDKVAFVSPYASKQKLGCYRVTSVRWTAFGNPLFFTCCSFCEESGLQLKKLTIYPTDITNFEGRILRVTNTLYRNGKYDKFFQLLEEITNRTNLRNSFGCVLRRPHVTQRSDWAFGSLENGNWTGMVGELNRKEKDLAIGPLEWTEDREKAIDFTHIFHVSSLTFITRAPYSSVDAGVILGLFTSEVWVAILVSLVFSALAYTALNHIIASVDPRNSQVSVSQMTSKSCWTIFGAFLLQGENWKTFSLNKTFFRSRINNIGAFKIHCYA
ncbi:uncharacterized protein LOC143224039 [Tachypleus tridentatus]|uniref:uncharacterized protein LOC143224039 n=1 Tax=Tachypleus tridentatus TaxID=6853 RepID=UPI003FCF8D0C